MKKAAKDITIKRGQLKPGWPKTKQQAEFCKEYLKDYNVMAAGERAKYSRGMLESNGHRLLNELRPYIQYLQDRKTDKVIEKVVADQETILTAMTIAAFTNPQSFIRVEVIKPAKEDELPIIRETLKPIMQLTPEQASMITNIREEGGRIVYDLMDAQENRRLLGMHQGMFHSKLIAEHRHAHLHATMDLSKTPPDKLAELEDQLRQLFAHKVDPMLGILPLIQEQSNGEANEPAEKVDRESDQAPRKAAPRPGNPARAKNPGIPPQGSRAQGRFSRPRGAPGRNP